MSEQLEDELLSYTREKRKALVEKLTDGGVPTDTKDQSILLAALDGLDRSALTRMRIRTDEKANTDNANAAAIIAKTLMSIRSNSGFLSHTTDREIPVLSNDIPHPELVPGEIEINPVQEDYDAFMKRMS